MKITTIDPLPNIHKFKNKEEFCNRLVQEVINITKSNSISLKSNSKIIDLTMYKNKLILKNEKLDMLLEKSKVMKEELNSKINLLSEDNDMFRNKLLEIVEVK